MFGWNASWWWVFPLICMGLCIASCLLRAHRGGHGWCCGRRDRAGELDDLRKEIQELKSRIQ